MGNITDARRTLIDAQKVTPTRPLPRVPKGVALLAFAELWERFSYFAILALLTLFLSADTAIGGWGWQPHDAILFYGLYAGLSYALPIFGSWIANNHLGEQRCIMIGVWLFFFGHLLLASPNVISAIAEYLTGVDSTKILLATHLPQGLLWDLTTVQQAVQLTGATSDEASISLWVYVISGGGFYLGLTCLLLATGFFKSTAASLVTKFFPEADARRDAGFAILFTAIYTGAILANVVAGGLGESLGWSYGFGAAALGMSLGISALVLKRKSWLGNVGTVPDLKLAFTESGNRIPLSAADRDRLSVLLVQSICTTIYAAAFFQKGGLLSVYTRDFVDRNLLGGTIPVTWMLSLSTIVFMFATPTLAWCFLSLAQRNANPSASQKLTAGLVLIAFAYGLLAFAEWTRVETSSNAVHIMWIVIVFALFGIADALIWPSQLALASKLAPKSHQTIVIGAWHLTVAFGVWAASLYGSLSRSTDTFGLFLGTASSCLVAAFVLKISHRWMTERLHGAERTGILPTISDPPITIARQ